MTLDISMIYHSKFWVKVYISKTEDTGKNFPSESNEILGQFVGFSKDVGHMMTFKILTENMQLLHKFR